MEKAEGEVEDSRIPNCRGRGGSMMAATIEVIHTGKILSEHFLIPMGISRYRRLAQETLLT